MTNEWDAAAPVYEDEFEKVTGTTVSRLVEVLGPREGLTFADVACGPGTVTMQLAARGAAVKASDFSPEMVKRARERAAGLPVEVDVADAASLPYADDAVDGAVSNFGVIFCPDIDGALRELARVTRRDGRLAMTAWTTERTNGWTTLLADDYADELGFRIEPRPMYRWGSQDEFAAALAGAGWRDVAVDIFEFEPRLYDPNNLSEVLTTPATRLALASLTEGQIGALLAYLERRGREIFDGDPVPMPRQAWLARGIA